jgi:uncharacterized membrane protein
MPNIHPILVHFPIAILCMSCAFDIVGYLLKNEDFHRVGWWSLVVGTICLVGTVISGLIAAKSVSIPDPARDHFETHQQTAFVLAAMFAVLLFWRVGSRAKLPPNAQVGYLALSLAGAILLLIGAWYGGEMVYRFGVGSILAKP